MKKTFIITLSVVSALAFGQKKFVYGEGFEYNSQYEKDIKLVLCDDYNQYVFSDINEDGYSSYPHKKIIIRKLDQNGSLIDTFIKDYANKTNGVIHNYLGSTEIGKDQFVVFTEEIQNKTNRKEIYQHVFNKKDGNFITTSIAKLFVESGLKQGTTYVRFSENGKYAAIINDRSVSKKTANTIDNMVIDLATLSKKWEKEITLDTDYMEDELAVTNSGRVLILRKSTGWKESSKLVYVSAQGEQEIPLKEKLILKTLTPVSINDQDYLVSFGYFTGIRVNQSNFADMAFINLQNGNIAMSEVPEYRNNTTMSGIDIPIAQVVNGKTYLYGFDINKRMPQSTSSNRFPDPIITYGTGRWFAVSSDGATSSTPTGSNGKVGYFVKGSSNYLFTDNYNLTAFKMGNTAKSGTLSINNNSEGNGTVKSGEPVLTSIRYIPESDRIIFLRKLDANHFDTKSVYNWDK
ncbi:hypothetical protein K0U91_02935 [Chryseobacterium chendengshani]|uniref:hypothetical protein n=1 Tax=Chryseobacterium sp. LJ668 TaxID=2864040 RepID=UPI001C68A073|nr:hypothetical protein [Chryseobacterium sp. LJ668]MBW8524172.1 hypothetical protein [Chryseobacterium sp. LJ668]QYK17104.1 hypothetical protein K0U91_02935 [Chryseobacterium sp. LJ668]